MRPWASVSRGRAATDGGTHSHGRRGGSGYPDRPHGFSPLTWYFSMSARHRRRSQSSAAMPLSMALLFRAVAVALWQVRCRRQELASLARCRLRRTRLGISRRARSRASTGPRCRREPGGDVGAARQVYTSVVALDEEQPVEDVNLVLGRLRLLEPGGGVLPGTRSPVGADCRRRRRPDN